MMANMYMKKPANKNRLKQFIDVINRITTFQDIGPISLPLY